MKKRLLLVLFFLFFAGNNFAQVNLTLAPPAAIPGGAGWSTAAGSATTIAGGAVRLVNNNNNQLGSVYYNTPENVTLCGAFTVDFDFQIIGSGGAGTAGADGFTFFFVNPLTNFTNGMNLGLPNPTDGFILAFDTYNNGPGNLTPLAAAYGFPAGYGGTYVEASTTDIIGGIDANQNWIIDGAYHHVHITYFGGVINIYFNNSATASITGNFPITFAGYFGFSASTGGSTSTINVQNVVINSNTISPITGTTALCLGGTTTLSDPSLGTWSSNNSSVATINSLNGFLSTAAAGTTTITYSYSGSCTTTTVVTVSTPPVGIVGNRNICIGTTTHLSDATTGGSWTSSNSGVATVVSTTGVVTGATLGSAVITYNTGGTGCFATTTITVGTSPGPISGNTTICTGATTTLSDAIAGGTWSSVTSSVATVGSGSGVVSGASIGTSVISYTIGVGCASSTTVTVNGPPGTITGTTNICSGGSTSTLSDGVGGIWSSSASAIASIGSLNGQVTTGTAGTAVISYTNSCATATTTVTSIPGPPAISGPHTMCGGGVTMTLTDATTGGVWSTSNSAVATIQSTGPNTILITSGFVAPGTIGTSVIAYTTVCGTPASFTLTVTPQPNSVISGNATVCQNATTTLSDYANGTWSSASTTIATIDPVTGVVSGILGGTSLISYDNGCGVPASITVIVTAIPPAITGPTALCTGSSITLSNTLAGGTWTSSNTNVSVIAGPGVGAGRVTGVHSGTSVITYSNGCGPAPFYTVTVSTTPTTIAGANYLCTSSTTTLSNDGVPTGTWSSSNVPIAAINSTSGFVTSGTSAGTTVITAANQCGSTTMTLTVATPTPIAGATSFCQNTSIQLSDGVAGGVWMSSNTFLATVDPSTGVVWGIPAGGVGNVQITYTITGGCFVTATVTTTTAPSGLTGIFSVCQGLTTSIGDGTPGGVWSSNNTDISISPLVGTSVTVTGVTAGTSVIDYTIGSCAATRSVVVNPLPATIVGPSRVCVNSTIQLSDAATPGNWSISNTSATIDGTGLVTGISGFSLDTVTYTLGTGCLITTTIAVFPLPVAILGNTTICSGLTTQLTDNTSGGVWSSASSLIATVGGGTGLVTGGAFISPTGAQTTQITYSITATGCSISTPITVNPLPQPITGNNTICAGNSTNLGDGTLGGTWSSSNTNVATIDPGGVAWGDPVLLTSTTLITYSLTTGCIATMSVVVNPLPATITGNTTLCAGFASILSDATANGTWSSSLTTVATINLGPGPGTVTAASVTVTGTTTITFTLPTGCFTTTVVIVNPLPAQITGPNNVCVGSQITLNDGTPGGTWTSSNGFSAPIDVNLGTITGANPAPSGSLITYHLNTGCTASYSVTVNPLPAPITGITTICAGFTTVLSDATPNGTWFSQNNAVAIISLGPGPGNVLAGTSANPGGTTIITYTLPTTCYTTTVVTVNPLPAAITGNLTICSGLTTQLSDATSSGAWSSNNIPVAAVNSTGLVTGGSVVAPSPAQTAVITYSLTTTGCTTAKTVTVNPLPGVIQGIGTICAGLTTILSDVVSGVWTSNNSSVAVVTAGPGFTAVVTGQLVNAQSTATITLTVGSGCIETKVITVNPLPLPIQGNTVICSGLTTQLTDNTASGTWSSSSTTVAIIGGVTGLVTGGNFITPPSSAQFALITYSLTTTGCIITTTVTVNPLPLPINGPSSVCQGTTVLLSDVTIGGAWSSSNTNLATIISTGPFGQFYSDTAGGIVGVDTITYTLGTGCVQTKTVTVNLQPYPIVPSSLSICNHASAFLSDATPGGLWTSSNTGVAIVGSTTGLVTGSQPGAGVAGAQTFIVYRIGSCSTSALVVVNTQPVGITGIPGMCSGASTTLADATPGGVWSTSNSTVATVIPSIGGGQVTGGANPGGLDTITYSIGTCIATTTVIVYVQPSSIQGTTSFCNHSSVTLSDAVGGGVWSSNNTTVASVGSATGIVTGMMTNFPATVGSAIISYTEPIGGCFAARPVTINIQPLPITGITQVCLGLSTQLSDSTVSGVWSVSTSSVSFVTVNSTGGVTGISAGNAIVDYFVASCGVTTTVTVNPLPSIMTGAFYVCKGSTTTLGDLTPGGNWSSSVPSVATVGVNTGIVYGTNIGTTMITYMLPTGCITTHTVTVIAVPAAISPFSPVCAGLTEQLTDPTNGGVWTLSDTNTAIIGSSSGVVTGRSSGTVVISYTLGTGCNVVAPLVVNPLSQVSGPTTVCVGQTINLVDTTVGGAWTSSNNGIATVNAVTGVVTGVHSGTVTIVYSLPTSCAASTTITVLPLPALITGTGSVCDGLSITLSDVSPGGVWSSSNPTVATIDPTLGTIIAGYPFPPSGITVPTPVVITYTQGGCPQTTTITVNPLPQPILGNTSICLGLTSQLSDATGGGVWSIDNTSIATIDATGVVTAVTVGFANVDYTISTGCTISAVIAVNPLPAPITGNTTICQGSSSLLSDATVPGAWFSSNGNAIMSGGSGSGNVFGANPGTAVITYEIFTGCITTTTVTILPLPTAVSGRNNVCVGSTVNLASGTGGVWSSTNTLIATIDPNTGIVTGVSQGTTTISYTIGTGCAATWVMTVNPLPASITGITSVCTGNYTNLSDITGGGVWSSRNTLVATVDPSGTVFGVGTAGTTFIDYTLPTTCSASILVTIATPPTAISGPTDVCINSGITLVDGTPGGTWSSSTSSAATILPGTGTGSETAYGVNAGFAVITYTMGGGTCYATYIITIDPLPLPITGTTSVCVGLTTQLFDATTPGSWSSSNPSVAAVDPSTGVVTGITAAGASSATTTISYTLPTGCATTTVVTVNRLPDPITGNTRVCFNNTRTLSDSPQPGFWTSSNPAITTVTTVPGTGEGVVYGVSVGVDTITYTIAATGCIMTASVEVNPLPAVFNVTGGGPYCAGQGGVGVGIDGSESGVEYFLYLGSTPTGTFLGTGLAMNFGRQIPAGTYTVIAENTFTTCSILMTGSVTVTITPTVTPTVSIIPSPAGAVCAGTAVVYTSSVTNGGATPAYQWSVNGVNLSISNSYTFTPANGDIIKVKVISSETCPMPDSAVATLTANVITPATPAVGVLVNPGDTVCVGTTVTFTAIPSAGGPSPSYQWDVNSAPRGTGSVFSYVPNNGDVVYVNMVSNYLCRLSNTAQSAPIVMDVQVPVIPDVTITASPGLLITQGESDTLIANVVNGVMPVYQWFVNGIPVPGATNSTYVTTTLSYPKDDSVGCLVTNRGACNESTFGWIYIEVHPLGVTQVSAGMSDLSVVPNPNKGAFTLKGTLGTINDEEVTIELTDMLGQVVYKDKIIARGGKVNDNVTLGSTLANGMYMLNVRSQSENKVFHIVVEQ